MLYARNINLECPAYSIHFCMRDNLIDSSHLRNMFKLAKINPVKPPRILNAQGVGCPSWLTYTFGLWLR